MYQIQFGNAPLWLSLAKPRPRACLRERIIYSVTGSHTSWFSSQVYVLYQAFPRKIWFRRQYHSSLPSLFSAQTTVVLSVFNLPSPTFLLQATNRSEQWWSMIGNGRHSSLPSFFSAQTTVVLNLPSPTILLQATNRSEQWWSMIGNGRHSSLPSLFSAQTTVVLGVFNLPSPAFLLQATNRSEQWWSMIGNGRHSEPHRSETQSK